MPVPGKHEDVGDRSEGGQQRVPLLEVRRPRVGLCVVRPERSEWHRRDYEFERGRGVDLARGCKQGRRMRVCVKEFTLSSHS